MTEVAYLRLKNAGSLSLKYQFGINILSETDGVNAAGKSFKLSDHIMFGVVDIEVDENEAPVAFETREEAISEIEVSKKISAGYTRANAMDAGEELYMALVVYMPTTIGNEANHDGKRVPQIELGMNVIAMQMTSERDSFDEFYDDLAIFTDGGYRVTSANLEGIGDAGTALTMKNDTETVIVNAIAGEDGKVVANIAAAPSMISHAPNVLSYQIEVTGQKPGADVSVQIFAGKKLMNVELYTNGQLADFNQYSYDLNSGYVTIQLNDATRSAGVAVYDIAFDLCDSIIHVFEDIRALRGLNGKYVVGSNFSADNIIFFGNGTTNELDLGGKTITAGKPDQYLFGAQYGSVLILNGNGTAKAGKGFMTNKENAQIIINGGTYHMTVTGTLNSIKHTAVAQNDSKIIINGGTFTTNVEDACLFFATTNSTIEVNGGFFENTADKTPDLFSMGTNKNNTNRIIITGGTFVNWNPLNDRMCYTGEWPEAGMAAFGGPWMLIPGGYTVISETQANGDIWYTVVPVSAAN